MQGSAARLQHSQRAQTRSRTRCGGDGEASAVGWAAVSQSSMWMRGIFAAAFESCRGQAMLDFGACPPTSTTGSPTARPLACLPFSTVLYVPCRAWSTRQPCRRRQQRPCWACECSAALHCPAGFAAFCAVAQQSEPVAVVSLAAGAPRPCRCRQRRRMQQATCRRRAAGSCPARHGGPWRCPAAGGQSFQSAKRWSKPLAPCWSSSL